MTKHFLLIIALVILISSCRSIEPIAPEIQLTTIAPIVQKPSFILIPISVNLEPYLKLAENELPKQFKGKETMCEGYAYSYIFNRNPLIVMGDNRTISYTVPGAYALWLNYCPKCTDLFSDNGSCIIPRVYSNCGVNEDKRRIELTFATMFQVGTDYKISTITSLKNINPIDDCKLTIFNYNATDKLVEEMKKGMSLVSETIDKEIGNFNLKSQIQNYWTVLQKPIPIGNYGSLLINPKQLYLGNYSLEGTTMKMSLGLSAEPLVHTDLVSASTKALPPLNFIEQEDHFSVHLKIQASYDSISRIVNQKLAGDTLIIKRRLFKIDKISVLGASNSSLTFIVQFSGNKKGTLYLTGTPKFDRGTQTISFPNMSLSLDTRNVLIKSAKWMFNSRITDLIRKKAIFNIRPQLETVKKEANKALNKELAKGVYLTGTIYGIDMDEIQPTEFHLNLFLDAFGRAGLNM